MILCLKLLFSLPFSSYIVECKTKGYRLETGLEIITPPPTRQLTYSRRQVSSFYYSYEPICFLLIHKQNKVTYMRTILYEEVVMSKLTLLYSNP
jgi:hypothetical protein